MEYLRQGNDTVACSLFNIIIKHIIILSRQNQINHVACDSIKVGILQIRGLLLKLQSIIINFYTKHYFKY